MATKTPELTLDQFRILASVYWFYYKDSHKTLAQALMKVLGFLFKDNKVIYGNWSLCQDQACFTNHFFALPLSNFDRECLEDILNKPIYEMDAPFMGPLFTTMSWVPKCGVDTWRLGFYPRGTESSWRDTVGYDELGDGDTNWMNLQGPDTMKFPLERPIDWLSLDNQEKNQLIN